MPLFLECQCWSCFEDKISFPGGKAIPTGCICTDQCGMIFLEILKICMGFPGGSDGKESACSDLGDLGSIPALGRSPGGRHGNPLQYSYLENRQGQRSLVGYGPQGHKESDTTECLSTAQICIPKMVCLCLFACFLCFCFACLSWVFFAAQGLSLVVVTGVGATLRSGFSLQWLLLFQSMGFRAHGLRNLAHRLTCPDACGIFLDQELNLCPLQ